MTVGESIQDAMRDEARSARLTAPEWREPRRLGASWVEESDWPEWDEPA